MHVVSVNLLHPDQMIVGHSQRSGETGPVGGHRTGIVADVIAEVETVKRGARYPATAGSGDTPNSKAHTSEGSSYTHRRMKGGTSTSSSSPPPSVTVDPLVSLGRLCASMVSKMLVGGDDRDPDLVAEGVVDDRSEDDVGLRMRGLLHQRGRLVDLEQPQVAAAGDGHQHALSTLHGGLQQRRIDGGFRGFERATVAA
ncbi:Uncharacterised protein [Mycobacteroides abscessus subsp. abscessus]|nr:Uncharacterised protein [Mycobacteroides abscessus subsp. abscessus]